MWGVIVIFVLILNQFWSIFGPIYWRWLLQLNFHPGQHRNHGRALQGKDYRRSKARISPTGQAHIKRILGSTARIYLSRRKYPNGTIRKRSASSGISMQTTFPFLRRRRLRRHRQNWRRGRQLLARCRHPRRHELRPLAHQPRCQELQKNNLRRFPRARMHPFPEGEDDAINVWLNRWWRIGNWKVFLWQTTQCDCSHEKLAYKCWGGMFPHSTWLRLWRGSLIYSKFIYYLLYDLAQTRVSTAGIEKKCSPKMC